TGTFPWGGTDANYIGIDSRDNQGVSFDNLSISTFVLSPVATLTATPASISNVDTSVPVTLDWTTLFAPGGATYEILDGSSSTIDSGAAAASGSLPLTLDGTAGDQSYTFNLLSGASVVASDTVTVTTLAPAYSKTQSAVRFDETSTAESVVLSLSGLANFPAGATYEISDDNNSAVTYFSTTTGTITDPLDLDIDVNPSLGSVTFTVLLKDSGGNVFDTLTYTVDSSPAAPLTVTNLFSDSYDRGTLMPDPLDIDSDVTGMSGSAFTPTVGAVYLETYQANPTTPDDASIQVSAIDTLQSATGTGMSGWAIDHNFIDTAISTDGALSVAMDLEAIDSGSGDFGDRYAGFGIGLSLDEINAFTDESGAAGTGPRGAVNAGGGRGVADFYCSVSLDDEVQVFANGVLVGSFPVDGDGVFGDGTFATTPVRLRTDFAFGDPVNFAANSFVFYQTFCDNLLVTSGYFRLTQGAANYIGFSSRATNFVDTDDLAITTVSSVDMPYPGDPMVTEAGLAIDNLIYDAGDVV
ncbi:MAG: hypothetical protein KDN05_22095, partial [Verrucomicrobiae bacterium]|nr:hypothetical protein [Verrucomicrobiae bacterium]